MGGLSSPWRTGASVARTRPPGRIGGPEAWLVWALATGFVVWLFSIQTGYAVVSPQIQQDAGLTLAQVGLAASLYTWVFALVQFFSGSLLDRFGTRPLLALAVAMVTVGAFLYSGTTDFVTLAVAQVVLAVGASFGFVGAGYVGGRWFPAARYGLMFGLVQAAASLGSAIGQPVIRAALGALDWRQLLLVFGAFGVLLVALFVVFVRDPAPLTDAARPAGGLVRSVLRELGRGFATRNVVLSAVFAGASFGTMLAIGTLWGPRLMEARGESAGFATTLTALAWLGLAAGAPLINIVSDRLKGRRAPAVISLLLQAVAIGLVIYLPVAAGGAAVALMIAVGLFSGVQMLGFTVAGESVAPRLIGTASAIVNGVCFLVGGLLTSIPSSLLPPDPTLGDYQAVLWLMPALLVVGMLAAALLRPVRREGEPAA